MFSRHIPSPLICEEMNIDSLQYLQALQDSLKSFILHVWESNEKTQSIKDPNWPHVAKHVWESNEEFHFSNTQTGHMLQNEKLLNLFLV
jgi:hypothetical protein